jgi:hypothetical protein
MPALKIPETAMETKHTPGPWTHAPLSDEVIGPRGQGVCSPCDGYDEEQWPVDARLIAAAPDLLKVARAASHALRSYEYGNASIERAKSVADAIDLAVAKAEGRA